MEDTFPKLLLRNYQRYGKRVAMRHKDFGIWNEYTWEDCWQNTKDFALGLMSLGLEQGDKVCIIGDNEPEWYWAELAVQAIGGVVVGMYTDAIPSEIEYLATDSESSFAVVNDQEQTDKFLQIKDGLPLKKIIYWDPKGMWSYQDNPLVIDFKEVMELGRRYEEMHPTLFEESIAQGKGDDTSVICYTSGTTGALPKGAMLPHRMLINCSVAMEELEPRYASDEYLSFVSPAWIAEQVSIGSWLYFGFTVDFPEEPETVQENIKEIGPQFLLFGSRQWESLMSMVLVKMTDAGFIKRTVFNLCMPIGYKIADYELNLKMKPPLFWEVLYQAANWICFRPIRDFLGLEKTRIAYTGGALTGTDLFRWFRAVGVSLRDVYGLSEVNPCTAHVEDVKVGTVGKPMPGSSLRISKEGEILLKSVPMFSGYYKKPEATAGAVEDGWFKSGDAGFVDKDGHLIVLDRVKDMLSLRGGAKYSPSYIENSLKFSPYVKDAILVGGEKRDYPFAIVVIDFDNVGKWAERNRIPYTTFVDLSQKPQVYDLILKDIERVDKRLPSEAQVHRYALLHKELDPDEGELTRTRKLRRKFMEERYSKLIEAAYSGESTILVEAEVKYQDGRVGMVSTPINIRSTE